MKAALRIVVGLVGLFNVTLGLLFLVQPERMAKAFFLEPLGTQGLATIRADFPAFFLTGGVFALIGAWRMQSAPLNVPLALLGIALFGRFVSLAFDGAASTAVPPIVVEAVMIAILLAGRKSFAGPR